jgi:alcohol dehydrogenase (NADP+)
MGHPQVTFGHPEEQDRVSHEANLEGDFTLDPEDVKKIEAIDKSHRFNDPSQSFGWNFYADLESKKK